jgi:hypothetical protein
VKLYISLFELNNSVHGINKRNKQHLCRPVTHLSAYQIGVYYTGVRLFNRLPTNTFTMKHDKNLFRLALRSYLLEHCFYSVNGFIDQTGTLV